MRTALAAVVLVVLNACGGEEESAPFAVAGAAFIAEEDAIAPPTWWAKSYGGSGSDAASALIRTNDGGYAVAGNTLSFSSATNAWVLKLAADGTIQWQKRYGEGYICDAIRQTPDGYVLAGSAGSSLWAWVAKLDASGNIVWQKKYNFDALGTVFSSLCVVAGGYTVVGAHGDRAFMARLDSAGGLVWKYRIGGMADFATAVEPTVDGGYIVTGSRAPGNTYLGWVWRFNASLQTVWARRFGSLIIGGLEYYYVPYTVDALHYDATGTIVVAGSGKSDNLGSKDLWVAQLNYADGSIVWQKKYGGPADDSATAIRRSPQGFIVAGSTRSFGAPGSDAWMLSLNTSGGILWQKRYGGWADDALSAVETASGGFVSAGVTSSYGAGVQDFWVVRPSWDGTLSPLGVATSATAGVYLAATAPAGGGLEVPIYTFVNSASAVAFDTQAIVHQQAPVESGNEE